MKRQRKKASVFASKKKAPQSSKRRSSVNKDASEYTKRIPVSEISSKSKASGKSKKNKKQSEFVKKLRSYIVMILFVVIVVTLGVGIGMYAAVSREMKDMDIQNLSLNYSSFVYCTDELGNSYELEQLYDDGYRIWLEPEEIPQVMKDAVVAIEDERFYSHGGVDLKRTFGAFVNWTFEKLGGKRASYGGSTITQQVVKNITHEKDRSVIRKVKEMMRAVALEKELSKDEILTLYLNIVFFANNCYGVEAASHMYFDKPAQELTYTEAATIAGITQRPSYYDPLKNPDNALTKRNTVLAKMNEFDMISDEEYEKGIKSDLNLSGNHKEIKANIYSYFVDQVINDIIYDLQTQKGYSETFARQQVFNGGLKIYTTMDKDIQEDIESVFENNSNFPSSLQKAQAAMIIIDPYTGQVKGMVGGKGTKTDSRGLNRATQTKRQPGSSFKPISVYAPAIELKKITAATITEDEKITIGNWSPKNSYSGFKGEMPLRKAIEISSNTVAVKTLQKLGIEASYNFLKNKFHISTLEESDKALSPLSLGGLTYGVTVEELAAAYGIFANKGQYIKPYTYTKVIDSSGKLLLENKPEVEESISPETAYIITSLLKSVVSGSSGTGKLARLTNMPVAGKTGTTNNNYDKWFVGYTPYYVGAVWYGFDTQSSIYNTGVANISAKLWGSVMSKVHENLSYKDFEKPSKITGANICTNTGKLASDDCKYSSYEYFISGTNPTRECNGVHSFSAPSPSPSVSPSPSPSASPGDEIIIDDDPIHSPTQAPRPTANVTQPPGDDTIEIPDDESEITIE